MGSLNASGLVNALAGAATVIKTVDRTINTFRDFSGSAEDGQRKNLRAQQELALKQLKQKQNLDQQQAAQKAALEREKIAADAAKAESDRLAALRRAVARQNVDFAARGLKSGDSGSSEAILLGLFEESDAERASREKLDTLRNNVIDQNLASTGSFNVLQRTQLQEKQRLERELQD